MQQPMTAAPADGDAPTATQVFFAWERLRRVYHLALAGVVLAGVCFSADRLHPRVVFALPEEALVANLCLCAGPVHVLTHPSSRRLVREYTHRPCNLRCHNPRPLFALPRRRFVSADLELCSG